MVSMSEWLNDWRSVANAVPAGQYDSISMRIDDQEYDVLQISAYDLEVDGEKRAVRTPSRRFDNQAALYTRRTRDLGLVRFIMVRSAPVFVLEPGAEALDWAAAVEGVSRNELAQAVREGAIGQRVARLVRGNARRSRLVLEAKVTALRERAEDAEADAALLRAELRARERDLDRMPGG